MRIDLNRAVRSMALALLVCCMVAPALAQEQPADDLAVNGPATPRFAVLPLRFQPDFMTAPGPNRLTTWKGSYTYNSTKYTYTMVGTAPSTGTSTTIKTFVIPVKVVITTGSTTTTYDPAHVLFGTTTVTTNTTTSPIFEKKTTYTQGTIDVGKTQYIDAYQRANFWGTVQTNTGYHVLLGGPTVLAEQTLSPPSSKGVNGSPFGFPAAEVDLNWFDSQLQGIIASFPQITPSTFVIFETYNVYLTQGGCCIGGYHTAIGVARGLQTYSEFTYVDHPGIFSQDVSALSHEVGEWVDDPLTNNYNTPCGILENGDPLEGGQPGHPYGAWVYTLHKFPYHLQDLVTLPYFGAPISTSVNGWLSFQNAALSVCSNGS